MNQRQQIQYDSLIEICIEKGGRLLSGSYVNTLTELTFECKAGHQWQTKPAYIKQGSWCYTCHKMTKWHTIETAHQLASQNKGRCLSVEYLNSSHKMIWQCSEGHIWHTPLRYILEGHWCPSCNTRKKRTIEDLQEYARSMDGKLLSTKYVTCEDPFTWQCLYEHIWVTKWSNIRLGSWCPTCAGRGKITIEDVAKKVEENGGTLLSTEYSDNKSHLKVQCDKGHQWNAVWGNLKRGYWCPVCKRSRGEQAVAKQLTEWNVNYEREFIIIQPKRYDFAFEYNGSKYIIEFDGEQHFEEAPFFGKQSLEDRHKRDIEKMSEALRAGYKVIRIDHTQIANVPYHISVGVHSNVNVYLSTPPMYDWLKLSSIKLKLVIIDD